MEQKSLENLEIYALATQIGNSVWRMMDHWDAFTKETIGKQVTRSADSVAANIAEGYGRFFYKDRRMFCYYSRGSAYETEFWIRTARQRNLIPVEEFQAFDRTMSEFKNKLNKFIAHLNRKIEEGKQ